MASLSVEFLRLLREDPAFREEVRRQVLTDELLALPGQMAVLAQQVAALVEAQRRTEERVDGLAQQMAVLTQRVDGLAQQVTALAQQVAALAEAQRQTQQEVGRLARDVGILKGRGLETEWRENAPAYLGRWFRGLRVYSSGARMDMLYEALDRGLLGPEEFEDLRLADVVAEGREVRVVVEVSWTVGREDVERARRRADLLARLGVPTVAVAAGCEASEDVLEEARGVGVWVLLDGRRVVGGGS